MKVTEVKQSLSQECAENFRRLLLTLTRVAPGKFRQVKVNHPDVFKQIWKSIGDDRAIQVVQTSGPDNVGEVNAKVSVERLMEDDGFYDEVKAALDRDNWHHTISHVEEYYKGRGRLSGLIARAKPDSRPARITHEHVFLDGYDKNQGKKPGS